MDKKEKILKRLEEQMDEIINKLHIDEFNIIGIFLYGSQNYNLDTENSDIDSKMLIIPDKKDFLLGKKFYSYDYHFENGEICSIQDIRHFAEKGLKNQNINFLEILFTDYVVFGDNEILYTVWNSCFNLYKEDIAGCNLPVMFKSLYGQAKHSKTYGTEKSFGKVLYFGHVMRYLDLRASGIFPEHQSYKSCIKMIPGTRIREKIISLKEGNYINGLDHNRRNIESEVDNYLNQMEMLTNEYSAKEPKDKELIDRLIYSYMNYIVYNEYTRGKYYE